MNKFLFVIFALFAIAFSQGFAQEWSHEEAGEGAAEEGHIAEGEAGANEEWNGEGEAEWAVAEGHAWGDDTEVDVTVTADDLSFLL